jgi:cellulose 1,4-beta-cellobiosidase
MVLVLSLWDDGEANMLWLDSDFPLNLDPSAPGVKRGPCARDSGKPDDVRRQFPNSNVEFKNIKFGNIGTTVQFEEDGITVKSTKSLQEETK